MLKTPYILPTRINVEKRADGALIVTNPNPMRDTFANVVEPLAYWADKRPDKIWLAGKHNGEWLKITYSQGQRIVSSIAANLQKYFNKGDIVAILSPNSLMQGFLTYALPMIGVIPAPITPAYSLKARDNKRVMEIIGLLSPKAVFVEGEKFKHIPEWVGDSVEYIIAHQLGLNGKNIIPIEIDTNSEAIEINNNIDPQDICKILLTSGSTGLPKAVSISHFNLAQNASQIRATFDQSREDELWPDGMVMVNHLPWSHSLGGNAVLNMITNCGDTLWIDDGNPTPEGILKTIEAIKYVKPNYHNTVPIGWSLLANYLEKDDELAQALFGNLVLMQYGGAALAHELYDRLQNIVKKIRGDIISVAVGYGATETGPTACTVHFPNDTMGLVGLPVPGVTLKLVPHNGKLEARVKGPAIMPFYYGNPQKTTEAFDDEGFYLLGDALKFYDPEHPEKGLQFDGRLSEEFKLSNGSFVQVAALRTQIINSSGGLVSDAVICGEGEEELGALLFLNHARVDEYDFGNSNINEYLKNKLSEVFTKQPATKKITKIIILPDAPSIEMAEITDKGYINQARCRHTRENYVAQLKSKSGETIILG